MSGADGALSKQRTIDLAAVEAKRVGAAKHGRYGEGKTKSRFEDRIKVPWTK